VSLAAQASEFAACPMPSPRAFPVPSRESAKEPERKHFAAPTGLRPVTPSPRALEDSSDWSAHARDEPLASKEGVTELAETLLQALVPALKEALGQSLEVRLARLEALLAKPREPAERAERPERERPERTVLPIEAASAVAEAVISSLDPRLQSLESRVDALQPMRLNSQASSCSFQGVDFDPKSQGISIGDRRSASLLSEDDKVVRLRRVSKEVTGKEISFLSRGFVVNFRRLMELQKVFAIIHELIKSTAIAALTLVLAGDVWQLGYSVMFVAILFLIYAFHAAHYDTMDISDYRHLVDLLEDDNGICGGRSIENPNRLLKALSLARTGRRRRAVVIILLFGMLCSGMWTLVGYSWTMELEDTGIWQIGGEFYATLLLVGTLMLIFHAAFEWLYWRETQCVMPVYRSKTGSEPWDPSVHGTPRRFRWFGLPSMWFTSNQAYADLSLWIQHAKGNDGARKVNKVFPEEMALFSLNATGACQLRKTLKSAKLYSVHRGSFLSRAKTALGDLPRASDPEELCVDFVFFDTQSREYLQPEEEYKETQVHALGRNAAPGYDPGVTLLSRRTGKRSSI
ncbi:unnamed protein product, partial [Effrenium voratum]